MDDYESLIIEVTGINRNTSRNTLDDYFSSSKRGGDIANIEYIQGSGKASITFVNAEGAKKALETGPHFVEKHTLTIRRTKDKNSVVFENRTEEISDSEMKHIKYSKRSGTINALVTFHSSVDFDKLQEGLKKTPTLDEKRVSIKTIPVCKTILVKNLPPKTTYDSVLYKFENERNGGGDVEEVHLDQEKGIALVEFKDPKVVDRVLSIEQTLESTVLSVKRYYPSINNVDLQLKSRHSLADLNPSRRERPVPKPRHSLSEPHLTELETSNPAYCELPRPKPRNSLPESHLIGREMSDAIDYGLPRPKPKHSLSESHVTELKTSDLPYREPPRPKLRHMHSLPETHITKRKTSDPTRSEPPRPKSRNSLSESHVTERETTNATYCEPPIEKTRHSFSESDLRERKTLDPNHNKSLVGKPLPKPRSRKPTSFPEDVDLDLYRYLENNYPAQMNLALKDPQPNIEMRDESVHFTFSTQNARDHFVNYLKDYKCKTVPFNLALLSYGLHEDIKKVTSVVNSAGQVSIVDRANEGFIKLVGRVMAFDRVVNDVQKCIANAEERMNCREDVIELLPVYIKLLLSSTRFQRLKNSLKRDGCELHLDDTKGKITVKGSQAQIQKLQTETQEIVGHFDERSLNQSKFSLLKTPEGLSEVKRLFPTDNVMFEVNDQGNVILHGTDQAEVQRAYDTIENAIGELTLPPSLKTKSIQDALLNELGTSIPFAFQTEHGQPHIVCFKENLRNLNDKVDNFLERKKTVDKRVPLEKVVLRYLKLHGVHIFQGLNLSSLGLAINYDTDALVVSGEQSLVDNCCTSIHKITKGLMLESVNFNTHESIGEVTSMPTIQNIERRHQCAIVGKPTAQSDSHSSFNVPPTSPVRNLDENRTRTMQCRYTTSTNGKIIEVHQGNILNHHVDYLVNSANDEMQHTRGLAKAIVEEGGQKIQEDSLRELQHRGKNKLRPGEIVITDGGTLMCKKVIHVVTSKCTDTTKEEHLRCCCNTVLMNASDGQTIAIPALGTGIFSVAHEVCAKSLVTAAHEFLQDNPSHPLREIHFVDNNPPAIEALMKEMTTRFAHDPNFHINELVRDRWRHYVGAGSVAPSSTPMVSNGDMAFNTPEGMEIRLTVGNLAKSTADVIVNTVGSDLNLNKNPCSKAILDEAGSIIQCICEQWYRHNGHVDEGNFVITDGGMLKCKKVFHVCCPNWQADNGEKNLRRLMEKLLTQVQTMSLTSIAIPAIGTGRLKFPESLVAKVLIEEAMKFSLNQGPSLQIKQCNIVVLAKNTTLVNAFREQFQNYSKMKNENTARFNAAKRCKSSEDETNGVKVKIIHGDIVEQSTDAIGFLVEEDITRGGQIGAALLKGAGESLVQEYSKLGKIEAGTIVMTCAGNLKAHCLLHMVIKNVELNTEKSIQDAVTKCLDEADTYGLTSLSLPAVGTGHLKINPKQSADILYSCIKKYRKRNEKSLKLIHIVVFQEEVFTDFKKAFECNDLSTSVDSMKGSQSYTTGMPQPRQQITLEIAAETLSDLTKIKEELSQVEQWKPSF